MADISIKWNVAQIKASDAKSWALTKAALGGIEKQVGKKSVYVIRVRKPFAISYKNGASPVIYIGEGDFESRFKSHIKKWIGALVEDIPSASIEVFFAEIKVRNNPIAYREVEADLIYEFAIKYGGTPLMNKQFETNLKPHKYAPGSFKPIQKEKGSGYKWGLMPLISNMAYPASLKGFLE